MESVVVQNVSTKFSNVQTWDDIVQVAADLRLERDQRSWDLGDLVNMACPRRKSGRPAAGDEQYTVRALAAAIGEDRSVMSQLAANAEFWREDVRAEIPPVVSWRQCAKARTKTGWKPGQEVTPDQMKQAMAAVFSMADDGPAGKPRPELVALLRSAQRNCERALQEYSKAELGDTKASISLAFDVLGDAIEALK